MFSTVSGLHCSWDTVDAAPPVNPSLPSQSQSPLALVPSPFWLIDVFKDSFYLLQCKPYVWTDNICCFIPNKHFYLAYSDSELFKQLTPKRAATNMNNWKTAQNWAERGSALLYLEIAASFPFFSLSSKTKAVPRAALQHWLMGPQRWFSLHLPETWISSFNISRTSIQIISSSLKNLAFCNLHKRSYGKLFLIGWSELSKPSINSAALKRFDFFYFFFNIYQCSFTVHSFVQGWAQPRMRLFIHLVLFQVSSFRS